MTACARCQWRSTPDADLPARAQLVEHAVSAGHPLCPVPKPTHSDPDAVCGRSLSSTDPLYACDPEEGGGCLAAVRENLRVIGELYPELHQHLRTVSGSALGGGARGGDGRPLPGGTVLALLGPGSMGGATRLDDDRYALALAGTDPETGRTIRWWVKGAHGPLSKAAYDAVRDDAEGREHQADNRPEDTASVEFQLFSWVEDWREIRGEVA